MKNSIPALESLGRILQLDVTVKNVCPNKRVALAVILTEVDEHGTGNENDDDSGTYRKRLP